MFEQCSNQCAIIDPVQGTFSVSSESNHVENVIANLTIAKIILCDPGMLDNHMKIFIGQVITQAVDLLNELGSNRNKE